MRKYFYYNNEYISGNRYWWRGTLQSFLIAFFGLGIYLICVTAYKRARSLGYSNFYSWLFVIYVPVNFLINFYFSIDAPEPQPFLWLLFNVPHFILMFSNGTPPESPETIQSNTE